MIRLSVTTENRWLELPQGVKVEVRPRTTAIDAGAAAEATRRVAAEQREAEAQADAGQPLDDRGFNAANSAVLDGLFHQYFIETLARFSILRWEGVGDMDGNPLPVSPDAVAAFASSSLFANAFRDAYGSTSALLAAEGNGSTPISGGDTAAAESTAPAASADLATEATSGAPAAEAAPSS